MLGSVVTETQFEYSAIYWLYAVLDAVDVFFIYGLRGQMALVYSLVIIEIGTIL